MNLEQTLTALSAAKKWLVQWQLYYILLVAGLGYWLYKDEVKSDGLDYIPLTGTEVDKPITGDIEISDGVNFKATLNSGAFYLGSKETDKSFIGIPSEISDVFISEFGNGEGDFGTDSRGFVGEKDFTPNITDLDFTQKKYVDNPETLITVLNNTDSTQLATIKGLLGIV